MMMCMDGGSSTGLDSSRVWLPLDLPVSCFAGERVPRIDCCSRGPARMLIKGGEDSFVIRAIGPATNPDCGKHSACGLQDVQN